MKMCKGTILKSLSGFYKVETETGDSVECRACGRFRKTGEKPVVGDHVLFRPEGDDGYIEEILPRRNSLVRPPVANIDQLLIVVSVCDPAPSTLVIDKLIAAAEHQKIEPAVAVSKTDLQSGDWLYEIYKKAGFPCFILSSATNSGIEQVRPYLTGKVTVLTGNTGAGKSSLLNALYPQLSLATGEISRKLGRGRHTTRQVELLHLPQGGLAADTPGFSSICTERYHLIEKEQLQNCFREFRPYLGRCQFQGCSHTCEKGCAVLQAVENGEILQSRHESYVEIYQELKDRKECYKK
ncbi:MAG: ribosome small subunit-dependent GTPase A [Oscillospiraceae bacterium]|jgi:ribosome biogenesis GTPase|nr:ribosome small subunit-dependent GTPase A [Oscillospiraceae bacterium]